ISNRTPILWLTKCLLGSYAPRPHRSTRFQVAWAMERSMKIPWCRQPGRRRQGQRGNAIIEASLLAPWMLFLFVGVLDLGFYTHAAIATENAARVAAQYGAAGAATAREIAGACPYALQEALPLPRLTTAMTSPTLPLLLTRPS